MKTIVEHTPVFVCNIRIPEVQMNLIQGYLTAKSKDEFQSEDETIRVTAVFPDGKQMDIKCCGSQDESSWTEAVLFDENGCELCCTEPCDEFGGTWELEYNDMRYLTVIQVKKAT